jgi:hypothetical protein
LFEKYLRLPAKEPDYRKGRNHADFITSLREKGYSQSYDHLENVLTQTLETSLAEVDL